MLTDPQLRSKVDALWDKLWSGGLSNPLDAIEQLSFLIFLKQLDEREQDAERAARLRGKKADPLFPKTDDGQKLRWSHWSQLPADQALRQVKDQVFPFLKNLGNRAGSFGEHMANAEFKINKPSLLIEACRAIEGLDISSQNQDVQGDLYEYLLSKLNTAGTNGQFRTPRHIIRMMVKMLDPRPGERVGDPAAGTCGFLVNAWQHLLETHTDPRDLSFDEEGYPHGLTGSRLAREHWEFCQTRAFTGYDSDSGMTMLRIGSMNLILHGLTSPRFHYADTLSKAFNEERAYDLVLANPPFKGAIDAADVNPSLPAKCKKTEILFVHLFLRLLENGGRAAVIVPDGVLFGSSNAHVEIRKKLIEENRLDGVVSMPSGVFRPYAGVSTAVLLFTKGASTQRIWFYDMEHDGFSLDDKRQRVPENDIPDLLACWQHRHDPKFQKQRAARLADLQQQIAPLKKERLDHHALIHRLKFEEVIAASAASSSLAPSDGKMAEVVGGRSPRPSDGRGGRGEGIAATARTARERAEVELAELQSRIAPLEKEINQLGRQFWVTKDQVASQGYDLSASRYRQLEQDEVFYERPTVTLERLRELERVAGSEVETLARMLAGDPRDA
ncbi:MAG: SAM-dependent DNA methyltransferase [Verrucomicrobiales bacterium]|nr:SAM-dependent DNA methyltransferase [Verrucomicrobiales bacterium]